MGYNRSGQRFKEKMRRRRKEERRLAAKAAAAEKPHGLVTTVKKVAKGTAEKVGAVLKVAKKKLTGKE
jgi:hypothetical protein